jgi:hypothetical protein
MNFEKVDGFDYSLLTQPWKVFLDEGPEYFTYLELAKKVNEQSISLSTRVTRREEDEVGTPVGEINEFTPVFFAKVKEHIAPPHTQDSHVRAFFRIEETKEVFLKFEDKTRICFVLRTFGAGGASFKSKELLKPKYLDELSVTFTLPNFAPLDHTTFKAKGTLIDLSFRDGDFVYTFEFKGLDSRKKVMTDRMCFEHSFEKS